MEIKGQVLTSVTKLVWDPFTAYLLIMSLEIEEVLGLVNGLAAVVKNQQTVAKNITSETQKQIQNFSKAVHELSHSMRSKDTSSSFFFISLKFKNEKQTQI